MMDDEFVQMHIFSNVRQLNIINFSVRSTAQVTVGPARSPFGGNMSNRPGLLRIICSLVLVLSLSMLAFADTIRLKDGSILKGKITSFAGGKFTIMIGDGSRSRQMTYNASEIESISFDSPIMPKTGETTNRNAVYKQPDKQVDPPRVITSDNTRTTPTAQQPSKAVAKAKPISWNIKVLADNTANGWTNTGWVVKKGQRIHISGDGKVSLGGGKSSPSSGVGDLSDPNKLLKNVPTGALLAVIGDDNNDFIYVGADREFTATRDGALFLGINEGNLDDNSGAFEVKIEVYPDGGE